MQTVDRPNSREIPFGLVQNQVIVACRILNYP